VSSSPARQLPVPAPPCASAQTAASASGQFRRPSWVTYTATEQASPCTLAAAPSSRPSRCLLGCYRVVTRFHIAPPRRLQLHTTREPAACAFLARCHRLVCWSVQPSSASSKLLRSQGGHAERAHADSQASSSTDCSDVTHLAYGTPRRACAGRPAPAVLCICPARRLCGCAGPPTRLRAGPPRASYRPACAPGCELYDAAAQSTNVAGARARLQLWSIAAGLQARAMPRALPRQGCLAPVCLIAASRLPIVSTELESRKLTVCR